MISISLTKKGIDLLYQLHLGYFSLLPSYHMSEEMKALNNWLRKNVGEVREAWEFKIYTDSIDFQDEENAILFKLTFPELTK